MCGLPCPKSTFRKTSELPGGLSGPSCLGHGDVVRPNVMAVGIDTRHQRPAYQREEPVFTPGRRTSSPFTKRHVRVGNSPIDFCGYTGAGRRCLIPITSECLGVSCVGPAELQG